MKLLVFSDSHGNPSPMREAILRNPDADCILYLGDGIRDLADLDGTPTIPVIAVRGNCDTSFDGYSTEEAVTFEGVRILLTHGHLYGVKGGQGGLFAHAKRSGYQIALFGHTHIPHESYDSETGIYLFNPGSIGKRDAGAYSFGIITLQSQSVLLSHGKVQ